MERLTQRALKEVDYLWRAELADGDDAVAKAFLADTKQTFTNDLGEQQKLFTTSGQQLFRPEMFGDTANPAFYKQFAQSGIGRILTAGLAKELRDSGIDLKNGAIDLAKAVRENPGAALNAVWNALKGLPQGIVDSFKLKFLSFCSHRRSPKCPSLLWNIAARRPFFASFCSH